MINIKATTGYPRNPLMCTGAWIAWSTIARSNYSQQLQLAPDRVKFWFLNNNWITGRFANAMLVTVKRTWGTFDNFRDSSCHISPPQRFPNLKTLTGQLSVYNFRARPCSPRKTSPLHQWASGKEPGSVRCSAVLKRIHPSGLTRRAIGW